MKEFKNLTNEELYILAHDDIYTEEEHKKFIEDFKQIILENAKKIQESLLDMETVKEIRRSWLKEIDYYVECHNADKGELIQYIYEALEK